MVKAMVRTTETALRSSQVLFKSNHLLVVNKPALVASQPDSSSPGRDLIALAKKYIKTKARKSGDVYMSAVHRLDRVASGCVCMAKTTKGAQRMQKMFASGKVLKEYLAIVPGELEGKGTILGGGKSSYSSYWQNRSVKDGWSDRRRDKNRLAKPDGDLEWVALGHVISLEKAHEKGSPDVFSLLAIRIGTGRKHQIRRQLASKGFPIVGDTLYGSKVRLNLVPGNQTQPILLHACGLTFDNPVLPQQTSGSKLPRELRGKNRPPKRVNVVSPPPRWWKAVFKQLAIPLPSKEDDGYFSYAKRTQETISSFLDDQSNWPADDDQAFFDDVQGDDDSDGQDPDEIERYVREHLEREHHHR